MIGNCSAFGLGFSMGEIVLNFCLGHNLWIIYHTYKQYYLLKNSLTLFVLSECFAGLFFPKWVKGCPMWKMILISMALTLVPISLLVFGHPKNPQILRGHGISTWIDLCFHSKDILCHQNIPAWKYRICPQKGTISSSSNHWFSGNMLVFRGLIPKCVGSFLVIYGA